TKGRSLAPSGRGPGSGALAGRTEPGRAQAPTIGPRSIAAQEYADRRDAVCAGMDAAGLDAMCVFYPARIAYLTGFHHIPTERPIALVIGSSGQSSLVVPAVEKEHAESSTSVDQVWIYFAYSGAERPLGSVAGVVIGLT